MSAREIVSLLANSWDHAHNKITYTSEKNSWDLGVAIDDEINQDKLPPGPYFLISLDTFEYLCGDKEESLQLELCVTGKGIMIGVIALFSTEASIDNDVGGWGCIVKQEKTVDVEALILEAHTKQGSPEKLIVIDEALAQEIAPRAKEKIQYFLDGLTPIS